MEINGKFVFIYILFWSTPLHYCWQICDENNCESNLDAVNGSNFLVDGVTWIADKFSMLKQCISPGFKWKIMRILLWNNNCVQKFVIFYYWIVHTSIIYAHHYQNLHCACIGLHCTYTSNSHAPAATQSLMTFHWEKLC